MKRIRLLLLTALAALALCAAASAEEPSVTQYGGSAAATASEPGGADNDELFYQYMLHLGRADADEDLPGGSTGEHRARAGLSEDAQKVYDILAENIRKIAKGKSESSIITISANELGLTIDQKNTREYNSATLYQITMENGSAVTEDTMSSIDRMAQAGAQKSNEIIGALLSDMPYELYWYDKVTGLEVSTDSYGIYTFDDGMWINKRDVAFLTFKFYVSKDYLKENAANDFQIDTNLTNLTSAASAAAGNAATIVADNGGKSDYEKIKAYKEKICELVSYNQDAANNKNTSYGNPWQLIYVFDNNTNTNVVCEGYAKAFQYLCDLTNFTSSQIQCYTVTGTMDGGTGEGNHMWNVITMDDGKNYLVDVTNCDGNSVGAPDYLFLKGVVMDVADSSKYQVTVPKHPAEIPEHYYNESTVSYVYDSNTLSTWASVGAIKDVSEQDYSPLDDATVDDVTLNLTGTAVTVNVGIKGCVYLLGVYNGDPLSLKLVRVVTVWDGRDKPANETLNYTDNVESGQTVKLFLLDGETFAPVKTALSQSAS